MPQNPECCLVEGGVSLKQQGFKRNILMKPEEIDQFRQKYNNTGVFVTAYSYNEENQDKALLHGDFYLDFDTNGLLDENIAEQAFEHIRQDALYSIAIFSAIFRIDPEQLRIYFSGKKGLHLIVPANILGVEPHKHLNEIYKVLAKDCYNYCINKTVDLQIYDRKRLFRLPGSRHNDTGLFKIPLTYQELNSLSLEEIKVLARRERTITQVQPRYNAKAHKIFQDVIEKWDKQKSHRGERSGEFTLDFRPPCIDHLLNNQAIQGERNNILAILASYAKQRGLDVDQAIQKLLEWSSQFCDPALSKAEITTTTRSIYQGNYTYGCAALKDLSTCSPEECRFGKRRTG